MNKTLDRITVYASETEQEKTLSKFKKRSIIITEPQSRQTLQYFAKKLRSYRYRSEMLYDRVCDVLEKFNELDEITLMQTKDGFGSRE